MCGNFQHTCIYDNSMCEYLLWWGKKENREESESLAKENA